MLLDFIHGLRLIRRNPSFSALAVLILALGIGATTAMTSLIAGIILNPLPFDNPEELAVLWSDFSRAGGGRRAYTAPADFFDWRDQSRSFAGMAAFSHTNRTLTALDQPLTPLAHEVTANYFDVLGVRALRGRTFTRGEDRPGANRVAIVSYALWKSALGGSDDAIGRNIELDGQNCVLVGVLPPGFRMPANAISTEPDLWLPASFESLRQERLQRTLTVIARLRPGATVAAAGQEMAAISDRIARELSSASARPVAFVQSMRDAMVGNVKGAFLLLLAGAAAVLLIACANVGSLLLARSNARAREVAVRSALGASRADILRQLLTESFALSLIGALAGVVLASWSLRPLLALVPESAGLPFAEDVRISLPVLGVSLALSVLTALVFGLAPARSALRAGVAETLKDGGRSRTDGRDRTIWRNALVVAEVSISLVLLTAVGLLIQTFWRVSQMDSGFEASRVLTVRNALRGEAYSSDAARRNHFTRAVRELATIPGVESVSAASFPPPVSPIAPARFVRANQAAEPGRDLTATSLVVLPGYFETLRIPILSGRAIAEADTPDSPHVVVVSKTLARRYFGREDPIGQTIQLPAGFRGAWQIVGIAGDVRSEGITPDPQPVMYLPYLQAPVPTMSFLLRTTAEPMSVGSLVERKLWSLGRLMNVYRMQPVERLVQAGYWQTRFTMILLGIFAAFALLLAMAGIYAVISYLAAQRTREIGIRIALGANPGEVVRMVLREGVVLAAVGVALGIAASLALSRLIVARLYGVSATDPLTLGAVALSMLAVAAAASSVPAWRAARIDPVNALRSE